jgi:UDP-N-acetylglucosamine 2-epimerase (non-hydrolysing)
LSISLSSSFHFAPTILSKKNLINEGIKNKDILVTGNTVIDALKYTIKKVSYTLKLRTQIINCLNKLVNFDIQKNKYILITGHRRENFGQGFLNICNAISLLSLKFPNYYFVYPVHLNPNVKKVVYEILSNKQNIKLINPVEYEYFSILMKESYFILTDSGGIQEEAPSLGKPVLVMRSETERPEGLKAGTILLVSSNTKKIVDYVSKLIENKNLYNKMSKLKNPYGNGEASKIIVKKILSV